MYYVQKNNLFLARLSEISANSNKNYTCYNFQVIAKISGNIKFPDNLQPYRRHVVNSPRHLHYISWVIGKWRTGKLRMKFV